MRIPAFRRSLSRWVALSVLAAFVVSACAPKPRLKTGQTPEGEVVEAEGLVPNQKGDLPATEAAALAAAQRAAVEKVVGVFISGKTRVEKAVVMENRVLSNTQGYISKYDILSKGPEGDFYRMKIRALVLFSKLGDDLKALGLLDVGAVGNPRVAVLIDEAVDEQPSNTLEGAGGLTQALLSRGYLVVDRSAVAGAAAQNQIDAVNKGDVKKAADLGAQVGAEVVVMGTVSSSLLEEKGLGGMVSYRARASFQAVRSGTGQVLGTATRDASALDASKALAATKALAQAASLAGDELAGALYKTLQSNVEISLVLRGIKNVESLQKFQEELRLVSGAGTVLLRQFTQGTADLSLINASKKADELAAFLARMKTVSVEVDTYSPSRIEATLKE